MPARPARTYGYARVSSRDQNLDRQLDALAGFGVEARFVYTDKASGRDFERPGYRRLYKNLRSGDTLVIASIDRLGRSYSETLEEWRRITKEKGAAIVVMDMPLLNSRPNEEVGLTAAFLADIVLQLLTYVAQVERENIKRRQDEGIAAAQARGVRFGRPPIERPEAYPAVRDGYLEHRLTRKQAAAELGVGVSTFDRWMKDDGRCGG